MPSRKKTNSNSLAPYTDTRWQYLLLPGYRRMRLKNRWTQRRRSSTICWLYTVHGSSVKNLRKREKRKKQRSTETPGKERSGV